MLNTKSSMGLEPVASNQAFLAEVAKAAAPGTTLWTCCFSGDPTSESPWSGDGFVASQVITTVVDELFNSNLNTYYSVASYKPDAAGVVAREKANFDRWLVLVIDDIKSDDIQGLASYVIETSPNNYQVGIFLDAQDPDCANLALVDALVLSMTAKGFVPGDKSGNNANRYVRLPIGMNHKSKLGKPHRHTNPSWRPSVRVTLSEAANMLGINLEEMRFHLETSKAAEAVSQEMMPVTGEYMATGGQADKLSNAVKSIITGSDFNDAINIMSGSLLASGMAPGSVVNTVRAIMESSNAPRNALWEQWYSNISRSVAGKETEYKRTDLQPFIVNDATGQVERKKLLRRMGNPLKNIKIPKMVVQGLFEQNALSIIFGPSMTYKSFVAVDLACSVAAAIPFHGHKTNKMAVIYVAGEGAEGINNRMAAWAKEHEIDLQTTEIFVTEKSVQFLDEESVKVLADEIQDILTECKLPLGFVFIDTISRNFGDGDESSAKDVARFLNIIDTHLRYRFKTNVCCIAHSGLEAGRIRGSTAWISGMDQQYETIKRPLGMVELKCHKMKDGKMPASITLATKSVYLMEGDDGFGETTVVDSLVLVTPTAAEIPTPILKGRDALTPAAMVDYLVDGWKPYAEIASFFECSGRHVGACIAECVKLKLLEAKGEGNRKTYSLTEVGRHQNTAGKGGLGLPESYT